MRHFLLPVGLFLLACAGAPPTESAAPAPQTAPPPAAPTVEQCREGALPAEPGPFTLLEVTTDQPRLHFFSDDPGCPAPGDCQRSAYLVPGDQIVSSGAHDAYRCGWYTASSGQVTVGFLPASGLKAAEAPATPWEGSWSYRENDLRIASRDGALVVSGTALWVGQGGNAHIGELADATAQPDGDGLRVTPYEECEVTLKRLGPWLVVNDNMGCGGLNVTFRGIYRRI